MTKLPLGLAIALATLAPSPALGQSLTEFVAITFTPNPGGGVIVSWPAIPKAVGYRLTRAKEADGCCNWSVDVAGTTLSVVDGLTVPGIYQYTVTARYSRITGPSVHGTYYFAILNPPRINRASLALVTACTPAQQIGGSPPGTVSPFGTRATRANISWAPVANAVAYKVERSPDLVSWVNLGCFQSSQLEYRDQTRTDLPLASTIWPQGTYTYKVTAYQSNGAAGWNSAKVTLDRIVQPAGATAQRVGNQVTVCWSWPPETRPDRFLVTSSYGIKVSLDGQSSCYVVLGVPDGNQTFRVGSAYFATPTMVESPTVGRPSVSVLVTP